MGCIHLIDQIQHTGGLVAGQLVVAGALFWRQWSRMSLANRASILSRAILAFMRDEASAWAARRRSIVVGGAVELVGAEDGQDLSRGAR